MAGERIPAAYVQLSDLPDDILEGVLRHIDPDIFETYSLLLAAATRDDIYDWLYVGTGWHRMRCLPS